MQLNESERQKLQRRNSLQLALLHPPYLIPERAGGTWLYSWSAALLQCWRHVVLKISKEAHEDENRTSRSAGPILQRKSHCVWEFFAYLSHATKAFRKSIIWLWSNLYSGYILLSLHDLHFQFVLLMNIFLECFLRMWIQTFGWQENCVFINLSRGI